jgi:hypothetical protein
LTPVVTDAAEAARRLELARLSVMAHGESEQGAILSGAPALRESARRKKKLVEREEMAKLVGDLEADGG